MKQMYEKDVAQVMEELGAVETGLRCEEVAERQNTYGRNELEEVKPVHPLSSSFLSLRTCWLSF